MKVYEYSGCDTCRKALKYLDGRGLKYERVPIVEQPPSKSELKKMLAFLKTDDAKSKDAFKRLFNTSGVQYRELGISDKIKAGMSEDEAIELLAKNGKLIKRPFILTAKSGVVGFDAKTYDKLF